MADDIDRYGETSARCLFTGAFVAQLPPVWISPCELDLGRYLDAELG
ncbi:hypothetical protein [Streptomyces sp. NPDC047525]